MEAKEFVVKRKCFSVESIVAALKQVELGMPGGSESPARDLRGDVLSVEETVRWDAIGPSA